VRLDHLLSKENLDDRIRSIALYSEKDLGFTGVFFLGRTRMSRAAEPVRPLKAKDAPRGAAFASISLQQWSGRIYSADERSDSSDRRCLALREQGRPRHVRRR